MLYTKHTLKYVRCYLILNKFIVFDFIKKKIVVNCLHTFNELERVCIVVFA